MWYITCVMFMILGHQITFSSSHKKYCSGYSHSDYTNNTSNKIKCFVEKDLNVIDNISNHLGHVRSYLDAILILYPRLLHITSEIKNKHQYLGNAMNVYSVLRRAAKDWVLPLKILLNLPVSFNIIGDIIHEFLEENPPEDVKVEETFHLVTAHQGLSRLQNVYNISADTLANGKLEGALSHTIMTVDECFEFAKYYYFEELNYHRALEWFDQTLMRLDLNMTGRVTEKAVLELYFLTQCFTGDFTGSKHTYKKLIAKYNKFTPTIRLLEDFEIMAKYGCRKSGEIAKGRNKRSGIFKREHEVGIDDNRNVAFRDLKELEPAVELFDLCNYPHNVYSTTARVLKCRYIHYNHPGLKIGPFKLEEYHLNPPVLLFHDVISDTEITEFFIKYKPQIKVTNVSSSAPHADSGTAEAGGWKVESVWVRDNGSTEAARLTRRAAIFSGWSTYKAEPYKLISYGISGALPPHIDTLSENVKRHHPEYADYSTVMFHLNEVDKGGYTIFPALNVTVAPVKGSALMWFNRKPDGTSDHLSMHASCPVLQGSKWILNKWFHVERQTFPRCSKQKNSSFKYFYLL